jgi:hypothetical protein
MIAACDTTWNGLIGVWLSATPAWLPNTRLYGTPSDPITGPEVILGRHQFIVNARETWMYLSSLNEGCVKSHKFRHDTNLIGRGWQPTPLLSVTKDGVMVYPMNATWTRRSHVVDL